MFHKTITTAILAIAAGSGAYAYYTHNVQNPWTRDGQVRAHIVQVTPRVTGRLLPSM
ncbi:membrane fusion component of tripartite multidrug resistance system [Vibrio maritimus]|uniref:Membrane fusion component of tripartite multidrug resistance system n=1 Tax=Vibrio maritimus TaxID=990268 RepID=A0A090S3S6_9VIBR|nr:membrane fusion component of tripartite multidrug resistance system [Vibrio maritimus]